MALTGASCRAPEEVERPLPRALARLLVVYRRGRPRLFGAVPEPAEVLTGRGAEELAHWVVWNRSSSGCRRGPAR
jgi:hypothetical protein